MCAAPFVLANVPDVLSWRRVGPGIYDSRDGRVTLYRIEGCYPTAWNVEWTIDYLNELVDFAAARSYGGPLGAKAVYDMALASIVDGAASFRDAKLLAAEAWPALAALLRQVEPS